MIYKKDKTYLITYRKPLVVRTKATDDGVEVTTLPPGHGIHCISYTYDDNNDIWLRISLGWIRATKGDEVYIQ